METTEKAVTAGVWNVQKGKEKEFIKEWTKFAEWSSRMAGASTGRLMQDSQDPSRFISVGEWDNSDSIQKWSELPQFKEAMSKFSELLAEPAKPHQMVEVAKVGELIIG